MASLSSGRIYRSVDVGASWTEITPRAKYRSASLLSGVRLLSKGKTLLALGTNAFRSMDDGDTWTNLGIDTNLGMINRSPAAAVNDRTFYKAGAFGIHRTTDGGESWHIFMDGVLGRWINDLVVFNNRLYAYILAMRYINQTIKARLGKKCVWVVKRFRVNPVGQNLSLIDPDFNAKFTIDSGNLYFVSPEKNHLCISHLSGDGDRLIPVQATPVFDSEGMRAKSVF